jgi:fluoroacetyl-CoA thioesterase
MQGIQPGAVNLTEHRVEPRHLASEWGSGLADVLATPALVAFCEGCARLAVEPYLGEGQQTVGTRIDLQHIAATPPGLSVRVRAELITVDGRRLTFKLEGWDEVEKICEGEHERTIIDTDRFLARVQAKTKGP